MKMAIKNINSVRQIQYTKMPIDLWNTTVKILMLRQISLFLSLILPQQIS